MSVRLTVTRSGSPKKRRDNPEQRLTFAVKEFLDLALPTDAAWWHTPNSVWTTPKQAGVHKAMGVRAGVADCLIIWRGQAHAIELKAPGGSLSPEQRAWLAYFERAGGKFATARDVRSVEEWLRHWKIPLRATVMAGGGIERRAA